MKIAIVGCGGIAYLHEQCINKMLNHKITAFVDPKTDRAKEFAKRNFANAYGSIDELMQYEKIDSVHICTPHYLHTPMALRFLEKGIHTFIEKPVAINWMQWQELKQVKSNAKIGFCFQNRFHPALQKLREILASGKAGKIKGIRGFVTWNRNESYYTQNDWHGNPALAGGGALINQSIHTMDLIDQIIGEPAVSLDAVMVNHSLKEVTEVEDTVSVYIKYPSDISVCLYATNAYSSNPPPLIELDCEYMRIRMEDYDIFYHQDGQYNHISVENNSYLIGKSYWGTGHADCIDAFYKSIATEDSFLCDIKNVEQITLLTLAAYISACIGKPIHMNEIEKIIREEKIC